MTQAIRYAQAELPIASGDFRIVVYRVGEREHIALVLGDVDGQRDVLARVHSECFTGEVLGSLRCDCRAQLDQAIEKIAGDGVGVVVYLRQEGRGIGLGNKIRAYALQDDGVDTVDANLQLGFEADMRSYEVAASILSDLGVRSVRLMTNNPAKLEGLRGAGIEVSGHESHWVESTEHAEDYLESKKNRMGHLASDGDPEDIAGQ